MKVAVDRTVEKVVCFFLLRTLPSVFAIAFMSRACVDEMVVIGDVGLDCLLLAHSEQLASRRTVRGRRRHPLQ